MKRPDFSKYDIVARKDDEHHKYVVVKGPYKKDNGWAMIVNDRMFGRYDRFNWHDEEMDARNFVIVKKGIVGVFRMKLSKPAIVVGVIFAVLAFFGLWFMGNYNSMLTANNGVDKSWADVEVQYQRRFDLVDNLVESVKGSQIQEQKVFGDIAKARSQYQNASNPDDKAQAATSMDTNIALIPKLQEAYPELRSNENVKSLMGELTSTENQIAPTRNRYNEVVTNYNNNIGRFPKNMFANLFGFEKRQLFKSESSAARAPEVNFSGEKREE